MHAVPAVDGLDPELFPDTFASMMIKFTILDCRLELVNASTEWCTHRGHIYLKSLKKNMII